MQQIYNIKKSKKTGGKTLVFIIFNVIMAFENIEQTSFNVETA